MTMILSRSKGDSTIEDMNNLAGYLLKHKMIETLNENCGVQEASSALCEFEVHVIRKRKK